MTTSQHPADKSTSTPIGGKCFFVYPRVRCGGVYIVKIRSPATYFFLCYITYESKIVQE